MTPRQMEGPILESEQRLAPNDGHAAPSVEPWAIVSSLAFVPGALIFVLPHETFVRVLVPICVSMGAFLLAGLVMLLRSGRTRQGG